MEKLMVTLKPRPLAIFFALLFLFLQFVFLSTTSWTTTIGDPANSRSVTSLGIGSPIEFVTEHGRSQLNIQWLILTLNLAATWTLAAVAANGVMRSTRLRRPARAYGFIAVVMTAITFLAALAFSKMTWGYYVSRPPVLSEIDELSQVRAVVPLTTQSDTSGKLSMVLETNYSLSERLAKVKEDSYYCLPRILLELERRNLLPGALTENLTGLPEIYPLIRGSGALVESSEGYDSASGLRGLAVDATGKAGDRLLFLCLTGGQVSDDHYPYYELLFRGRPESLQLTFVRSQHFFYDVAGMEGFEWYAMWLMLAPAGIVAAVIVFTVVGVVRRCLRRDSLPLPTSV
jgi:hypothetical protein